MNVLVIRAAGPAQGTAERLGQAGHHAVVLPLMAYRDTGAPLPEGPFDGLVFTSAAAAGFAAARMSSDPHLGHLAELPAFCVANATAQAAQTAGFMHVETGPGTAAGLADMLAKRLASDRHSDGAPIRLLYPAPEDRAFDLRGTLAARDISIVEAVIYKAEPVDPGRQALRQALDACKGGAALLHSQRAARHLAALTARHGLADRLAGLTLIAISENVAAAVADRRLPGIMVSKKPDEDGLFDELDRLARSGGASPGIDEVDGKRQQ